MPQPAEHETDVAIIGAGPIGIELAVALKHANIKFALIDAGNVGSTFAWWAPGTRFFSSPERISIAGVPLITANQDKATREEYMAYLRGVAQQFDLTITSGTRVERIERESSGPAFALQCEVSASSPALIRANHLVLAIGNMHHPRLLNVPGEDRPHVSHYLRDPHHYFGRRVLIVGGKNSAVEAAICLHRVGARVTISYRGETFDPKRVKYWLRPELEWLIQKKRIDFLPRTEVEAIEADGVRLRSVAGPSPALQVANEVLLLTGYVQDTTLFEQLGVTLEGEDRAPAFDSKTMCTNVPGMYVAGTAAGGSQRRAKLFIENTHVHVRRILRDIAGVDVPWKVEDDYAALEES